MGKGKTSPNVGRSSSVTGWVQHAKNPAGGLGSRATFTYLVRAGERRGSEGCCQAHEGSGGVYSYMRCAIHEDIIS